VETNLAKLYQLKQAGKRGDDSVINATKQLLANDGREPTGD
jgi:hypothetical protein